MKPKDELWDRFYKHLLNEQLTRLRIRKLKSMYSIISLNLDLAAAGRPEIEQFLDDLNINKIRKYDNKPYSGNTKVDIKKFLKQFYKWLRGNNETYPAEVSWIKTRIAKDEKPKKRPVAELKDIIKIVQGFEKYDYRIMTLLLFDSGFRIQEMISCKKKDLTWAEFDEDDKCFWIKCNISKTFPRNVPVPLFTAEINAFFHSSYYQAKEDNDSLFKVHYEGYLHALAKHSKRVVGIPLTPHCLRHSSATFYAKEYAGNVPLLAQRYGWSYSAKELQVYVRESGAYNKEGAKISYRNEVSKLREENERLKVELQKYAKGMASILNRLERIEQKSNAHIDPVAY